MAASEVTAPRPPAPPKAAVAARFCHQVLVFRASPPRVPALGIAAMIDWMPGQRLGVGHPVAPHQGVHRAGVLLAKILQLVLQEIDQDRDIAIASGSTGSRRCRRRR